MSTGPLNSSAPSTSTVVGGVYNVASPAPLAGQEVALQLDVNGNLLVNIAAGSVGGGVQYADGATQVTPTGTVALGKNPSNILHALGLSAAGNLNVNLAEGSISGGNAAASPTGAAVPASADYSGVNIGGNLVGVTGLALGGTTKAPTVAIVDGSGNQITTFGGGTQFADNAASGATPTGTLSMGWDSVNSKIRSLKVDASQDLLVAFPSAQAVTLASTTITGTVSVTQGTTPWTIQGNSSSGAAKAGNPVQIGGVFNTTQPTVTTGQTVESQATARGALIVAPGIDGFAVSLASTTITGTVAVTQSTSPWVGNITQLASTVLGTPQTFGTAPTGVVIGTSSDIYVSGTRVRSNQTTTAAGVVDTNLAGVLGVTAIAAAAGIQKVGISGNSAATLDSIIGAATAPTNALATSAVCQTTVPVLTAGQAVAVQCDTTGSIFVNDEGRKATYSCAGTLSVVTGATDAIRISGSSTKTVRVTRVAYYGIASTAVVVPILYIKRSTANSGGTSSNATAVPFDSNDATATAVVTLYTANPTGLGTGLGTILQDSVNFPTAISLAANDQSIWEFGRGTGRQAIVLRGTAQGLAVNLNGTAITAGVFTYFIEWTEE